MPKVHDRGGWPNDEPVHPEEHVVADWERRVDALHSVLGEKGLRRTDELRRTIENLPLEQYESLTYYQRWTVALESLLVEKGVLTSDEVDRKMGDLEQGGG